MAQPGPISLGLGLTNQCDLTCSHCYRQADQVHRLSYDQVASICDRLPLRSVNLGTGENGLHPDFRRIVSFLLERDYKVSITSNGYSIGLLTDDELRLLHDVELSLDFPTEHEHDGFRVPGSWRRVMGALERCHRLGGETTIATVMMNVNYRRMGDLARCAAQVGANLRVNVYQPVRSRAFVLAYDEFWEGFRCLLAEAELIACTEPVICVALDLPSHCSCGRTTVRVSPQGEVLPCVYWPTPTLGIAELCQLGPDIVDTADFRRLHALPMDCGNCEHTTKCAGGCGSRRALLGRQDEPDPYCPKRHPERSQLSGIVGRPRDLPKAASSCTVIVRGA